MTIRLLILLLLPVLLPTLPCFAQDASRLIGTWEWLYIELSDGRDLRPPQPVPYLTFTADGFHSYIGVPTGRKAVEKPLEEMSKEELLDNYKPVLAFWGPYSVLETASPAEPPFTPHRIWKERNSFTNSASMAMI